MFVIHPVQWEAVCNVPGRSILLSAFFVLSSFVLFLEFYKNRAGFVFYWSWSRFFWDYYVKNLRGSFRLLSWRIFLGQIKHSWSQKLNTYGPFVIGIAGYLFLRQYFGITNVHQTGQPDVLILGFVTFLRSVITDLRLFVFPVDLHYDRCLPFIMSLRQPQALGTCFFWAAALIALVLYCRKIHPFILFLMVWFSIELLPVSQLVASIGVGPVIFPQQSIFYIWPVSLFL